MINLLDYLFFNLNNNSYFVGIMMILLNLSAKYIMMDFGIIIDYIFRIKLIRRIMLFTIFFTATRNIKVSIILTGLVIILTMELFNEKSKNCILPKSFIDFMNKEKEEERKKNKEEEIKNSINILKKYKILT